MSSEDALAAIAEARSLDGADVEGATDLVENQGRQSLAVDVLSDDEQADGQRAWTASRTA